MEEVARRTHGFSGVDLSNLLNEVVNLLNEVVILARIFIKSYYYFYPSTLSKNVRLPWKNIFKFQGSHYSEAFVIHKLDHDIH